MFSAWSIRISSDQKALLEAGSDGQAAPIFQDCSQRDKAAVVDHGAGKDMLCKLALYSIWLMPSASLAEKCAVWTGFETFVDECQRRGWWEPSFAAERGGVAAALGYIHGGVDIPEDACEPETAPRNWAALDKFFTRYADFCTDPDGKPAPFCLQLIDNSKGPGDNDFVFCQGLIFFARDLSILAAVCPAGGCSTENPGEKVQGALSNRTRGAGIHFDEMAADKSKAASNSLGILINRVYGATFKAGAGGGIEAFKASDLPNSLPFDTAEIKSFQSLSTVDRASFTSRFEGQYPGFSSLMRKVYAYQHGLMPHKLLFTADNYSFWCKVDECPDCLPWRGPDGARQLILAFGGTPPPIVPSLLNETSYMRLDERLRTIHLPDFQGLEPDA